MLGYIGGQTFHEQTLLATGLGMLLALGFAVLVELAMSRLERRRSRVAEVAAADADDIAA